MIGEKWKDGPTDGHTHLCVVASKHAFRTYGQTDGRTLSLIAASENVQNESRRESGWNAVLVYISPTK